MVRETRYLWIGNLPHTIREDRILEHFKRYGKVQSVKILAKKEEESSSCATVAFIDIKSASKAHNADNKIDDRTLKTDYYEPAATASTSAIYIHERPRANNRYGISEERNYDRPGHYYADREPYIRRPLGIAYHDEDNYQGRAKSRDRYSRSTPGNNYTEPADSRNQNHFRGRQHFEQQRYPVAEQYSDEREPTPNPLRINRRTTNTPTTPVGSSPPQARQRRSKRRTPSSGSRSNSGSRSRSTSGSPSSSSSSKLRSSSSDSSGRSCSPSKSRSPANSSFGSQSITKGNRPSSAIANPSSSVCYLPPAVNSPAINCTSNSVSTPSQPLILTENHCEEKRPLGICVRNLPVRSTDTSLKDGLFHEYKKHGKVTMVKVIGQGLDRYAVVCFKKTEDVDKALEVSKDKLFFGCKIEVTAHEGLDAEDNEFRPLEAELDEFHPKATRTLFIGNLEKDITTPELRNHFEQFGEIIEIDIKKQGSASSYAFIQYSDIASVVKAMRKLDGENLGANRIKLGFGKSMPTNCVWLDGIVESVSDKFLGRHFSRFGNVAYTAIDREKGHALVFYENVEFAQIAVSEMRGRILQGTKLQVDFASRECQTNFFDKLEMTGQMIPGDGTRPWDRRERRPEFEVVRNDDRDARLGFENRAYPRYDGTPRPQRGNFRGGQRAAFSSRGRGQGFSARYETYHDEFGERRHRYNSREESILEVTMFDGKSERLKYVEGDCPNRKRNKLRNSTSDQESHHSQSPPRSSHPSRSTSPVSKDRKSLKERLHHRIKSPGSHSSSLVNSPCRDTDDVLDMNSDYRDSSRFKCDDKLEEGMDLDFSSPQSSSEKEISKMETDSVRSRSSIDAESADESVGDHLERKKRLLTSSTFKSGKEQTCKSQGERAKVLNSQAGSIKPAKHNCTSDATTEEVKCDTDINFAPQQECTKEKPHQTGSANTDLKYLQKKQVHLLQLLEQLGDNATCSEAEALLGSGLLKHRSPSVCSESSLLFESENFKLLTKDDCAMKQLYKTNIKDPEILAKLKAKIESIDSNNCGVSLSLDSFIFQKHLDPRKGSEHLNSLVKCRRVSADNETCLPNPQGANDSFLCTPTLVSVDLPWKKECNSINDIHFHETETDGSLSSCISRLKEEPSSDDETLSYKKTLSLELPNRTLSLRTLSDIRQEVKKERDNSPLSLPLPKFAASLRSPKSSPSVLMSPKSTTAHSPRAGFSPSSYASFKNPRLVDLMPADKKVKDSSILDEKMNGAIVSLEDSRSPTDLQVVNELPDLTQIMEPQPIQSPKSNCEKVKESPASSESEFSPSASPNRPSIEDRIKALDEKFNVWSGSARTATANVPDAVPVTVPEIPKCPVKRSRFNFLAPEIRSEPSDIVKCILAKSTIFDQDSQRLQHIDEKYEPLNVKVEDSPKAKPTFRTKAAAKEFSMPIAPALQSLNQSSVIKTPNTILVAQGVMSPPSTPLTATGSVLSPITPPVQQYNSQLTPQVFTPCSPSFHMAPTGVKTAIEKELSEHAIRPVPLFNSIKVKTEPGYLVNSSTLATSLKSPLHCPVEVSSHSIIVSSPPTIKKEPASPTDSATEAVCKFEIDCKVPVKKELKEVSQNVTDIPLCKDRCISITKEHLHFNSFEQDKKEFCHARLFNESSGHWRENGCKEEIKVKVDSCAKSFTTNPVTEITVNPLGLATKKRVSSIDSTESESSKSVKSMDSSRDSQDINWCKHDKSEPEAKRPKLNKNMPQEHSSSPPRQLHSKKVEKKEKSNKVEKNKISLPKTCSLINTEKPKSDKSSCNSKSECKDRIKSEHKVKEEKKSRNRESKESSLSKDQKSKSRERRNSEKETKSTNSSFGRVKKDTHLVKSDSKSENSKHELKPESKHDARSESKHEARSESKHDARSESKHDARSESKHDARSESKHDARSESKHEARSESKHEARSESKHEARSESKHEARSESKHDHKSEIKYESKHDKRDFRHENKSEKHDNRRDSKNENKGDNKSDTKHKNRMDSKQDSKNESDNDTKSEDTKSEKKGEKKSSKKSSSILPFDFQAFMDDEPVYFSMYDKVKARSSKTQTLKHQTSDLESVRQKFSKLKQSRAKREEKSKSIEESDKESDTGSHHSSESDSQAKSTKTKQPRKRKLVIESSSDDDVIPPDINSRISKMDKDFSDSATDSEFEFNVSRRQPGSMKGRKKKADLLNSDSSDSDSNIASKPHCNKLQKKTLHCKSKPRNEKSRKTLKSDFEISDIETSHKNSKEKESRIKKFKKDKISEIKSEAESMDCEATKRNSTEESKSFKKKSKDRQETDFSFSQKKSKSDHHQSKDKSSSNKEKKRDTSVEKMQVDDVEKHKPYSKKRKKSKKMSRNKEKRELCDKGSHDCSSKQDSEARLLLPVLSPKPSNALPDKPLSPPCLQAGVFSDNDFKSDFSDFDFDIHHSGEPDLNADSWKHLDVKSDTNSEKVKKNANNTTKSHSVVVHSSEHETSLPSYFDKLSDVTDSETGKDPTDCDKLSDRLKHHEFSLKRDKESTISSSPYKSKHEESLKSETNKYSDSHHTSKEERKKKKSKKQSKEKRKKAREERETTNLKDVENSSKLKSPPQISFESLCAEDSRLSDLHLAEEDADLDSQFEREFMIVTPETSTFEDDGPVKKEEKLVERRFEEEAAKETRRLEAELFSTGRDSWHMKEEKDFGPEINTAELCSDKMGNEINSISTKDESLFSSIEIHSSITEASQNDPEVFLSGHVATDPYKLDDKEGNEIEDQRKIEDDLAVSALLQEMNSGEVSAPELTKETDYLEPIMETHPEDTMNYLIPDDENSLHIADSSPDIQAHESQDDKLESSLLLSPLSNSEPPALEISHVEGSVMLKIDEIQPCISLPLKIDVTNTSCDDFKENKLATCCYDFPEEDCLEIRDRNPPVIDHPAVIETSNIPCRNMVSPKAEHSKPFKVKEHEKRFSLGTKLNSALKKLGSAVGENQLTHFEDITMDNSDSKDDDNPPVLLPVESPRNLLPAPLVKEKIEITPPAYDRLSHSNTSKSTKDKTPDAENLADKSSTDTNKQFDEILDNVTDHPRNENKPSEIPDSIDKIILNSNKSNQNKIDTLCINNTKTFHNYNDPLKPLNPLINTESCCSLLEEKNIKYFQGTSSALPHGNYTNTLSQSCERSVIQSPTKSYKIAETPSLSDNAHKNISTIAVTSASDVSINSADNFLLDLFGPKSDDNETIENRYTEKEVSDNEHLWSLDSKNKTDDSNISLVENHSSQETSSFEISEVNEQNEATEFNQEIFERSEQSKDHKIPQLLSFSSDQLFTNLSNPTASVVDSNLPNRTESNDRSSSPNTENDMKPESDPFLFHSKNVHYNDKSDSSDKHDTHFDKSFEEPLIFDDKPRPADAESVCSDTTDITLPDKVESEMVQSVSNEEPSFHEDTQPTDGSEADVKPKAERPRRGRRPKTRRFVEKISQKQDLPETNVTQTRSSSRRARTTSSEKVRRTLRSEPVLREHKRKRSSVDELLHSETDDIKVIDSVEVIALSEADDPKVFGKNEEPKRRRGRRKKDFQTPQPVEKLEPKPENIDLSKDSHRTKESRWFSSISIEKEQKDTKDASKAYDVFEFHEEEEGFENISFEKIKASLHDNSKCNTVADIKHDKIESKQEKVNDKSIDKHEKATDIKHNIDKASDLKLDKSNETKHEKMVDPKHDKASDHRHERGIEILHEKIKTDENIKEEKDFPFKDKHSEIKELPKIPSIRIRIHPKDGHDGTAPSTAEVVKTSDAPNIEEVKSETAKSIIKTETTVEVPYNGPCKSTRKSTRLMNQAQKSAYDDAIEEVAKGKLSEKRVTRRSRSNRRSEENISRDLSVSENSEDMTENKNEPVFYIRDNAIKDASEEKKKISALTDASSIEASGTESDKTKSLRNFRLTRSNTKQESTKDASLVSDNKPQKKNTGNSLSSDEKVDVPISSKSQKDMKECKESVRPPLPVLKVDINKINAIEIKAEANRSKKLEDVSKDNQKSVKISDQEDCNSNSDTAALVDPVTGIVMNVDKIDYYSENSNTSLAENKCPLIPDLSAISKSVLNIKSVSKIEIPSTMHLEKHSATSVIQENSKNSDQFGSSNCSWPKTAPTQIASNPDVNLKPYSLEEKIIEPLKIVAKKNAMATTVLAIMNSPPVKADMTTTAKKAESIAVSQNHSPVITTNIISSTKSPSPVSVLALDKKSEPPKTLPNYEPQMKMTSIAMGPHLIPATASKSTPASCITSVKSEISGAYTPVTSANSLIDQGLQMTNRATCQLPKSLLTPVVTPDHALKQESPSPSLSVASWPNTKVQANRIADVPTHVNAISLNSPNYPAKPERTTKTYSGKNNPAFQQQQGFSLANYEEVLSGVHNLTPTAGSGVIAEMLQNSQLMQHKEYFSGSQLADRNLVQMVRSTTPVASSIPPELAARLNPTPPHTPTPPVTSSNHSLPPTDLHSGLHIRHSSQGALMVPHPSLGLHPSDINSYVHHQQMIYAAAAAAHNPYALHTDLRAQQEARAAAAIGMNSRYGFHSIPSSAVVSGNFKQPSDPRHPPMDAKAEQKLINDLSKVMHETRNCEDKSQRSKSLRIKKEYSASQKEKEMKISYSECREDLTSQEKMPTTSAIAPHSVRQPQHAHFSSPILQLSPRLTVSPLERTDSPVSNLYVGGGRSMSHIALAGQEEYKPEGSLNPHYKTEEIKPPVAHQTQPSTNPYHVLEASVIPRQQLLGMTQIGSASSGHLDSRSVNPTHSPGAHSYKKDPSTLHNDKRDHSKKMLRTMSLAHQGASISSGLPPAHSPLPWPAIQSHSPHLSQNTHLLVGESRRATSDMHAPPPPAHLPPDAHARLLQTHSHPEGLVDLQKAFESYPPVWQGILALKNDQAQVQMHYMAGNQDLARNSLPGLLDGDVTPLRVAQRMRLEPVQLEGVKKKLQVIEEHCILVSLPCGKNEDDYCAQSHNLEKGFIQYLKAKQAAGIVNTPVPGTQQPAYVIHIFPSCDFTDSTLKRISLPAANHLRSINYLVIIITTV